MNKTAQNEWQRLFLIERLPEPLTPASAHVQIFDNYIEGTRLRLRAVRDPKSKSWSSALQQHFLIDDVTKCSEINLSKEEYAVFEHLEGREVRKNRYFHELDGVMFGFDVYLGPLWGLTVAKAEFASRDERDKFVPPPFARFEITSDPFFDGGSLVDKTFREVQAHLMDVLPVRDPIPDE